MLIINRTVDLKDLHYNVTRKGTFLSEDTDAFVITSNRQIFFFPEAENLP